MNTPNTQSCLLHTLYEVHTLGTRQRSSPPAGCGRWGSLLSMHVFNALAYTLELPPEWICHKRINVGLLKRFRESATFPRVLPRRAATRGSAALSQDDMEVLETRTRTRRGRTRQEVLAKWAGERQAQWISTNQLRASLPHDDLLSILGPEGT